MHNATFYLAHNQIEFYTWGEPECCLPKGATGATLKGNLPHLLPGDVLVFEAVRARSRDGKRMPIPRSATLCA